MKRGDISQYSFHKKTGTAKVTVLTFIYRCFNDVGYFPPQFFKHTKVLSILPVLREPYKASHTGFSHCIREAFQDTLSGNSNFADNWNIVAIFGCGVNCIGSNTFIVVLSFLKRKKLLFLQKLTANAHQNFSHLVLADAITYAPVPVIPGITFDEFCLTGGNQTFSDFRVL